MDQSWIIALTLAGVPLVLFLLLELFLWIRRKQEVARYHRKKDKIVL